MKVSIIIPIFDDGEKLMNHALPSVLNQESLKDFDYELIIVDDCSTKERYEYLEEKYNKVKVIRSEVNMGDGLARREGIKAATGDWVMFLDSDDELIDGALAKLFEIEMDDKWNIIVCDFISVYEDGFTMVSSNCRGHVYPWTHAKLWRRSFILEDDNMFTHPTLRVTGDCFFTISSMMISKRKYGESSVKRFEFDLYNFNIQTKGSTTTRISRMFYSTIAMTLFYTHVISIYENILTEEDVYKLVTSCYLDVVYVTWDMRDKCYGQNASKDDIPYILDATCMWFNYVHEKFGIYKFDTIYNMLNKYSTSSKIYKCYLRDQYNYWIKRIFIDNDEVPDYSQDKRIYNVLS